MLIFPVNLKIAVALAIVFLLLQNFFLERCYSYCIDRFSFLAPKKDQAILFCKRLHYYLCLLLTIFSFGIQWYTLNYLPVMDCLAFKKGNNIPEKMKMPADAVPDSTVITFVYEKEGKEVEFTSDKFPADFNDSLYKFVNRYDKVIRKGNEQ